MKLIDAVYIITGGSSGLGKAMALEMAKNFTTVVITGRDKAKLKETARETNSYYYHADVTNDAQIDALYKYVLRKFGRLDGIINNAGIGEWAPIEEVTREKMQNVFEVNIYGAAMMTAKVAPIFKKQKSGDIVNIASTASLKGYKNGTIYAASKFALRGMSQCWQDELRPFNVRVIQINPSEVPTAFGKEDREERPLEPNKLSPAEIAHVVVAALKMDNRGFIPELSVYATNPF